MKTALKAPPRRIYNSASVPQKDCIFCKIVAGKLPSYRVYEDERHVAFLNDFVDLDLAFPAPGTGETNVSVLHLGAATNAPARFYRVRLVP